MKIVFIIVLSIFLYSCTNITDPVETSVKSVVSENKNMNIWPVILYDFQNLNTISWKFDLRWKAPRYWFFEASFPISIVSVNNKVLVDGYATWDWLSPVDNKENLDADDMIDFEAHFDLWNIHSQPAKIKLSKDNPRWDENNEEYFIDILIQ